MESHAATDGFSGVHPWSPDTTAFGYRTSESIRKKSAQLQAALGQKSSEIFLWMQKGSLWRTIFVSSVSIVLLLGFAGLGTFILFLLAATLNAVAIGFLASVATVGAFAALFFSILTTIYIGTLVVAASIISAITFFCICAALIVAGWIAFFWAVWRVLKKGTDFVKSYFGVGDARLSPVTAGAHNYVEERDEKKES